MIIKASDFTTGNYKIPNVVDNAPNSDLLGNNTEINEFISKYVPECMVLTLGYELWTLLSAELDVNGDLPVGADQRWQDLVNGKDRYQGLKSILVPFVYFYFLENDESHHGGVGIVQEEAKGATRFMPVSKAVKAWREFYRYTIGYDKTPMAWEKMTIRGNATCYDWYGTSESLYMPLYVFLRENESTYPEAVSTQFENINYYGI